MMMLLCPHEVSFPMLIGWKLKPSSDDLAVVIYVCIPVWTPDWILLWRKETERNKLLDLMITLYQVKAVYVFSNSHQLKWAPSQHALSSMSTTPCFQCLRPAFWGTADTMKLSRGFFGERMHILDSNTNGQGTTSGDETIDFCRWNPPAVHMEVALCSKAETLQGKQNRICMWREISYTAWYQ